MKLHSAVDLRQVQAQLICEYGNIGWTYADRCEMSGNCPSCQEKAAKLMPDKPRTSDDWFNRSK